MFEKLFLFFKGYLIVELDGECKERFMNLCKNKTIEIIHIFSVNHQWFCKLGCRDYKKIYPLAKKTGCRMKIKQKKGFPFMLENLAARKGLILGGLLFWLILFLCSGRIWKIEVEGGFLHTKEQILRVLREELNVYGGAPEKLVDCFEIEKRLRLDYSEIGWISVEKKGCSLSVMMNESVMPRQVETLDKPCHIVAEYDGVVTRLEILSGIPVVKVGDEVKKGDVLVLGIVPVVGDYGTLVRNNPVGARGAVYLESDFFYNSNCSMKYERKNFQNERFGLEIFLLNRKLFSYIPRYSDKKYDIMSTDIVPYVFEDYKVPVMFRKYRCLTYESEIIQMTEKEVKEKAEALWTSFLDDWKAQGVQIIETEYSAEIQQKKCMVSGRITACGNFISYQEILEEEWKTENEHSGNNP